MRAGALRHVVVIQQTDDARDTYGGTKESATWSTYVTRRARIEPLLGQELWDAQRVNPEVTVRIRMRYTDGVTPKMRVKYTDPDAGARYFAIESVIDVREEKRELHLLCGELVGREVA